MCQSIAVTTRNETTEAWKRSAVIHATNGGGTRNWGEINVQPQSKWTGPAKDLMYQTGVISRKLLLPNKITDMFRQPRQQDRRHRHHQRHSHGRRQFWQRLCGCDRAHTEWRRRDQRREPAAARIKPPVRSRPAWSIFHGPGRKWRRARILEHFYGVISMKKRPKTKQPWNKGKKLPAEPLKQGCAGLKYSASALIPGASNERWAGAV